MANWEVRKEMLGQKVIMAYKLVIPGPDRGPMFMNIQVKIIEDMGDSLWVEMTEQGNLAKMQVPKENIQHLCYISELKSGGITLPSNFRS